MKLSETIKVLRESLGMTQAELAKAVGYTSRSSISKIEKGESDPSQKMLIRLATALEVKPSELISEDWAVERLTIPFRNNRPEELATTKDEFDLLIAYRKASPAIQEAIKKLLDVPEKKVEEPSAM